MPSPKDCHISQNSDHKVITRMVIYYPHNKDRQLFQNKINFMFYK